jgi:hypothetical protein
MTNQHPDETNPRRQLSASMMLRSSPRFLSGWILPGSVLVFCLASCALLIAQQARELFWPGEVGYGDLYVFHTVQEFWQTGVIYQDLARDLPSTYGPMLYSLLAVSGRFSTDENPLVGPRLIVLAAFLLSVLVAVSITRRLIPHRKVWLWSVPLAFSFTLMSDWVLQIRGDFMAIFFSLVAVRLLLARKALSVALLAGACAGFATQFKFTYVAALAAGLLWLAASRRWTALAVFALGGALTSIGIYAFFVLREPRMLDNVLALRKPIVDYAGLGSIIRRTVAEPVALLGLATLPFLPRRLRGRWGLVVSFVFISSCIAAITDLQAGGNVNYFFEALFGLVPLAAFAILKLRRRNYAVAGLFLSGLLVINLSVPLGLRAFKTARSLPAALAEGHRKARFFRAAFQDRKVLSFVPAVTFFASEMIISDPFMTTYMERLGKVDLHPLAGRIQAQVFDLIVTPGEPVIYRGIDHVSPTLRPAIQEAYQPFCRMGDAVILVRRNSAGPLTKRLVELGCDVTAYSPR